MLEYPARQLTDDLALAESPEAYDAGLLRSLGFFDELNAGIIESDGLKLACGAGCSICCSLRVDVFAHEVFLIARHIQTHFSPEELSGLLVRLAIHSAEVLPLTPFDHATRNVGCPLLVNHRCSVYAARGHSCRRHHSQDLAACQYTYDHPTDLETPAAHDRELFRTLSEAMQHGIDVYAQFGFDLTIYELGTALAEALETPASWERWRAKEQAFLRASVTPAG